MANVMTLLARPRWAARRVRELGPGRLAIELVVKRWRIATIGTLGPVMRKTRIAFGLRESLSRRRLAQSFLAANGNPLRIPEATGYRVIQPSELPEHKDALDLCRKVLKSRPDVLLQNPDSYGLNLLAKDGLSWTKEPLDLRPYTPLLDLASSPSLLAAAAGYLGEIPVLASVQVYATTDRHTMAGNNFFHFDKDHRMVKFWMAITDIDDESGPFTFMPADKSRIIREKVGYHGRLADEKVYAAVPGSEKVEFKGPAGSMLLVDTCRCVHFGSRTRRGPRVMLLLQYQSAFAWAESGYYYQPVTYETARYAGDPVARKLFSPLRKDVPGVRDW